MFTGARLFCNQLFVHNSRFFPLVEGNKKTVDAVTPHTPSITSLLPVSEKQHRQPNNDARETPSSDKKHLPRSRRGELRLSLVVETAVLTVRCESCGHRSRSVRYPERVQNENRKRKARKGRRKRRSAQSQPSTQHSHEATRCTSSSMRK